ncbi:MAG: tRNA (adenosine(37)-N6)-dimethylallyltransferase MiaA [Candidatus Moranbacteria bacterium]|nr:tRNA (adenosine(37)-N6)-dimethylallyltransferase MiaA [Candidatus Moranbacteria bacterium]
MAEVKEAKPKIIAVVGPTACGKTQLAVKLAKKFQGEIVSADSRQIYKGLDIGTGKDLALYGDTPYHLIDIVKPTRKFSLAQYQKKAYKAISTILSNNKLPIMCGGAGLYVKAVVRGLQLPQVKPDQKLRKKLEKATPEQRTAILEKYQAADQIDLKNPHRVIRAIEICKAAGANFFKTKTRKNPQYRTLQIGIKYSIDQIRARIKTRVNQWLEQGLISEVKQLHDHGLSFKRLEELGLEYRYVSYFLDNKFDYQTMVDKLITGTGQYAKKQITWFKKQKGIYWIKSPDKAEELVEQFLQK